MATLTLGTLGTTTLTALQFPGPNGGVAMADADVATIQQLINDDVLLANSGTFRNWPGAFSKQGSLFIPNRGVLKMLPGDWVAVDPATGWPILISGNALPLTLTATGNTHTSTLLDNLSVNVLALGWQEGMPITGTDVPALTTIASFASDGKSLTLSKAATGTHSGNTYTVSNFTHS